MSALEGIVASVKQSLRKFVLPAVAGLGLINSEINSSAANINISTATPAISMWPFPTGVAFTQYLTNDIAVTSSNVVLLGTNDFSNYQASPRQLQVKPALELGSDGKDKLYQIIKSGSNWKLLEFTNLNQSPLVASRSTTLPRYFGIGKANGDGTIDALDATNSTIGSLTISNGNYTSLMNIQKWNGNFNGLGSTILPSGRKIFLVASGMTFKMYGPQDQSSSEIITLTNTSNNNAFSELKDLDVKYSIASNKYTLLFGMKGDVDGANGFAFLSHNFDLEANMPPVVPKLTIQRQSNLISVSWPVGTGYRLLESTNMLNWNVVTGGINQPQLLTLPSVFTYNFSPTNTQKFFELQKIP